MTRTSLTAKSCGAPFPAPGPPMKSNRSIPDWPDDKDLTHPPHRFHSALEFVGRCDNAKGAAPAGAGPARPPTAFDCVTA